MAAGRQFICGGLGSARPTIESCISSLVYKTIYIKSGGTWEGKETLLGTATVQVFVYTNILAIDVGSWTRLV